MFCRPRWPGFPLSGPGCPSPCPSQNAGHPPTRARTAFQALPVPRRGGSDLRLRSRLVHLTALRRLSLQVCLASPVCCAPKLKPRAFSQACFPAACPVSSTGKWGWVAETKTLGSTLHTPPRRTVQSARTSSRSWASSGPNNSPLSSANLPPLPLQHWGGREKAGGTMRVFAGGRVGSASCSPGPGG